MKVQRLVVRTGSCRLAGESLKIVLLIWLPSSISLRAPSGCSQPVRSQNILKSAIVVAIIFISM